MRLTVASAIRQVDAVPTGGAIKGVPSRAHRPRAGWRAKCAAPSPSSPASSSHRPRSPRPVASATAPAEGSRSNAASVSGSHFDELRLTVVSPTSLERLCGAIYPQAFDGKLERGFKKRELLRQTDNERWTYEQISVPVVSDRDYVIHAKLEAGRVDAATAPCPSRRRTTLRDRPSLGSSASRWCAVTGISPRPATGGCSFSTRSSASPGEGSRPFSRPAASEARRSIS